MRVRMNLGAIADCPVIPEMEDLYEDMCDGACICTLVAFYRPQQLRASGAFHIQYHVQSGPIWVTQMSICRKIATPFTSTVNIQSIVQRRTIPLLHSSVQKLCRNLSGRSDGHRRLRLQSTIAARFLHAAHVDEHMAFQRGGHPLPARVPAAECQRLSRRPLRCLRGWRRLCRHCCCWW